MVRITEQLIRKRAEHNDKIIATLEEISLHQCDLEKIEYLDKWCRDLQILYLQSNLIPKIENLGRLKKVKYINLGQNIIERIENLEGCESLEKLDLMLNFIGTLTDIERLKVNLFLKALYLTGNPFCDFEGYREYVVATLPNLARLDGVDVSKSERIQAVQSLPQLRPLIVQQQNNYLRKREREKQAAAGKKNKDGTDWYTETQSAQITEIPDGVEIEDLPQEEQDAKFWNEPSGYTPEARLEMHQQQQKQQERDNPPEKPKPKKERRMYKDDGSILKCNTADLEFKATEDDMNIYLDLQVPKFLDTSMIDIDIQPKYVSVKVKNELFRMGFDGFILENPDVEVKPDSSTAKRSQITGHLLLTMPKLNPVIRPKKPAPQPEKLSEEKKENKEPVKLEVDPTVAKSCDIASIVSEKKVIAPLGARTVRKDVPERLNSENFVDDDDVPPLM